MAEEKKKRLSPSQAWRDAKALIWAHRSRLAVGMALMLVNRLAGLVLPASSKYLIDEVIGKQRADLLVTLALVGGGATVVQAVASFALSQVLGVAAQRAITEMRKSVQAHVARLPVRFFDSTQTGVLISRVMTDAEGIRNLVGTGLVQLVGGVFTAVLALGVLFYLNWRLTLITLVALGLFGGAMSLAFTRLRPLFRERGKINAEVTGRLAETLGGIRVVKAYSAERRETLVFARGAHRLFRNVARSMTGVSGVTAFSTVIVGAIGVILTLVGGRAVLSGEMTLGDLFMYIFFTALVAAPLVEIASIGTQITEAFAGLDRIREVKRMATEDEGEDEREPLGEVEGEVVFEDVTFEYEPGAPVLRGVSFRAPAGTTTALVGSSGSGKSTLIGLVMAFSRPVTGRVLVDGRDLADVRLRDYRRQLGVVLQDNFLFDGTVAENIAFADPHASRERVERAGRVAHCEEFVEGFEKGYDTVVGERGVRLSGGQRQRVAIARAVVAEPRILILDEATSSLDSESEALIQDGLQALRRGRTTFVIAHRLSTIRSADQILVLEAGEIVERGTHEELLARGGRYRQLHDKQYRFELNRFVNPGEDFTPEPPQTSAPGGEPSAAMPTNL
ncbi:MAG: ABC transporter ATP-binding protein/permease [Acidobacteria bacterium]|nr:ABC transporter ATP-binding protein/permease [Acidobacteriota bacterium]MCA1620400.1 ABC transporter ATP-binding protein/permease [Acidobacteriota bacterium]